MSIIISQDNYNVIKQTIRNTSIKIDILNFDFQVVDSIEGTITSGNITIDANADVRRTCDITVVIKPDTFPLDVGGQIWIDKYIQIYYGTEQNSTGNILWVNMGIYIINNPNHVYDATNNTITFSGLDLMAKLTGLRNGYLEQMPGIINAGEELRGIFIDLLNQAGFTKYIIEDTGKLTEYDINVDVGESLYDVFNELLEMYPNYEMFFDVNGVFNYKRIYNTASDPIVIDNDLLDKTTIKINNDIDFENVKNAIEIWGAEIDPSYGNPMCTVSNSTYVCTIAELTTLSDGIIIGFAIPSIITSPLLQINSLTSHPIVNEDGTPAIFPEINEYYIVTWDNTNSVYRYKGRQQVYAYIEDTNPDSPFYINGTTGKILIPLYGGEYDNIKTDSLANDRALWELYNKSRMNDAITLTSTIIPWIDVNIKIQYINNDSNISGIFVVKTVNMDFDITGAMTIKCIRWYDYDPFS